MSDTDSSIPVETDPPPDWDARTTDLLCPLCKYNLRHLTTRRCPECGFKFTWNELLEAERERHNYLFEHGRGHSIRTFWRTYWRTCQPRRFWKDLSPAQPVNVWRLMMYCLLATGFIALCMAAPAIKTMITIEIDRRATRATLFPQPNHPGFYQDASGWTLSKHEMDLNYGPWPNIDWKLTLASSHSVYYRWGGNDYDGIGFVWAAIFLVWPWFTVLWLLIFRFSMRQKQIRFVHLLRTVVYSCDFGFLVAIALIAIDVAQLPLSDGVRFLLGAVLCSLITGYRLTIAFRQYLRVHLPLATVLASQLISLLVTNLLLLQIADFALRT